MERAPPSRAVVLYTATPAVSGTGDPRLVAPSLNWTVPAGVPATGLPLTVAVNVTSCPGPDGFGAEMRAVDDSALFTTWARATALVEPRKFVSPEYTAVMLWVPMARSFLVIAA